MLHPSDMILEQSNDDDESFIDRRTRRGGLTVERENISLIEDDYILVDQVAD